MGSIPLSSHAKDFKNGIHRSSAWCSAVRVMWRMKYETKNTQL